MLDPKLVLQYTLELRVLYVEDEEVVAKQTTLLLGDYFNRIDHAHDGQDALSKYKEAIKDSDNYDLIITDINMPNMDGIELCEAIYKINQDQKIIVVSAHNEAHYLYKLINLGVDRFLNKPIEIDNIMKTLYSVCQSISDHKHLQKYYDEIEDLNENLTQKNHELEKAFRMYDTMVLKEKLPQVCSVKIDDHHKSKIDDGLSNEDELLELVKNDLPELLDIHQEMDALIVTMLMTQNSNSIKEFGRLIQRYSAVLSAYYTFYKLSASFKKLSEVTQNEAMPDDEHQVKNILSMLESFLFTLNRWQDSWTSENKTSANFFDDSLSSDIETIISLWSQEESFDEIEFF